MKSDLNDDISDLKIAEKSRGEKCSLKSRREKIEYLNPGGLWSDPYGARRLQG